MSKPGSVSICPECSEEIIFTGTEWRHTSRNRGGHYSRPVTFKSSLSASEITKEIFGVMEPAGWLCFNSASERRSASGLTGFTDVVCLRGGVTILAEIKAGRDRLSEKQLDLLRFMRDGNTGPNLIYILATLPDEVTKYVNYPNVIKRLCPEFFVSQNYKGKT